jgi:hypothetical protein
MVDLRPEARPTRYPELGYWHFRAGPGQGRDFWQLVDMQTGSQTGPQYRTRAELLADLDYRAGVYGCSPGGRPEEVGKFGFAPRDAPPTLPIAEDNATYQEFLVWVHAPTFQEDETPYKCLAAFWYLQEALDYVRYCTGKGKECWLQTRVGVTHYGPEHAEEPCPF